MLPSDFCYWLNGYFELNGSDNYLTFDQVKIIKDHLQLVFNKVTPDRNKDGYVDFTRSVCPTINFPPVWYNNEIQGSC